MTYNSTLRKNANQYALPDRKCLECGNLIQDKTNPVYRHGFCSQKCKDRYMGL